MNAPATRPGFHENGGHMTWRDWLTVFVATAACCAVVGVLIVLVTLPAWAGR